MLGLTLREGQRSAAFQFSPVQPQPPHRILNSTSLRPSLRTSPEISRPPMRQLRHQSQERLGIPPPRLALQSESTGYEARADTTASLNPAPGAGRACRLLERTTPEWRSCAPTSCRSR